MKSKDLRIGNYVFNAAFDGHCQVEAVDLIAMVQWEVTGTEAPFIEPLPLTEDWLLRFGFSFDGSYYKNMLSIRIKEPNDQFGNVWISTQFVSSLLITEVHQLQNLYFALTGTELTLKP